MSDKGLFLFQKHFPDWLLIVAAVELRQDAEGISPDRLKEIALEAEMHEKAMDDVQTSYCKEGQLT